MHEECNSSEYIFKLVHLVTFGCLYHHFCGPDGAEGWKRFGGLCKSALHSPAITSYPTQVFHHMNDDMLCVCKRFATMFWMQLWLILMTSSLKLKLRWNWHGKILRLCYPDYSHVDNCHHGRVPPGQLPPRTTAAPDKCHIGQLPIRTTGTQTTAT